MSKQLILGNGNILINLDQLGQVRDFYFPYVGLENQIGGHFVHRIGVFADGSLSWLSSEDWKIFVQSEETVLAGNIRAMNDRLGVALIITDIVYNEKNIFLRRVLVKNTRPEGAREIKIFFNQQFEMYESHMAHTVYYDPLRKAIIHYRNQRAFLINAAIEGHGFDDYSTGVFGSEGKEGTHRDAEDGVLSKNNIEHGQVDSVIGLTSQYQPLEEKLVYYWVAVGNSIGAVGALDSYTLEHGPGHLMETTSNFWKAWVTRQNFSFHGLTPEIVSLFQKSLLIMRAHVSENGAIIASGDSNVLQKGKDTYCYVWPRDAAIAALALSEAGDTHVAKLFFSFCNRIVSPDGYFMHKYSPDESLGSSWHPWLRDGQFQLPIQEDGTALVLHTLWRYYEISKDLEFVESIYNSLVKLTADFLVLYRDEQTGLPRPSYDLWEERFGISTFTASSVVGALRAAAKFAGLLGKKKSEVIYEEAAESIRRAILEHLYDANLGRFCKLLWLTHDELRYDMTIDASTAHGLSTFNILSLNDPRLVKEFFETEATLSANSGIGGIARYQNDAYQQISNANPGNPWFITTLWFAQHIIKSAQSEVDLAPVKERLEWCTRYATRSGLLSEQLNPLTGEQLSVSPLVWSHAEFVRTVIAYLDKLEQLGVCKSCNPVY
ncbi:MAG TPA: glycoside hydrolase family 15 protein [Candidatus Paceibacterota bacterium]